ncbi:MAG: DUF975 family protein [Oscillospiraceae bacterium]|nr:DUF975 family protein [Oscillospiraceae bacterium]
MHYTPDYKKTALDALKGNWPKAIIVSLIASIVSGVGYDRFDITVKQNYQISSEQFLAYFRNSGILPVLSYVVAIFTGFALIISLAYFILSGSFRMGYCTFNLNLIDNNNPQVEDLFSQIRRIIDGICLQLLTGLYTFLWALLFVIPGIVKSFAYSMAPYIMAENPGMTASQAITMSKELMNGKKMDLFVLKLSFLGWGLLAGIPSAIVTSIITNNIMGGGNIFTLILIVPLMMAGFVAGVALSAYMSAAEAAFYRMNITPKYTQTTEY